MTSHEKVTVNWDELSEAFGNSGMELRYFLDTDTGQVLMVTAEDQRYLQELYEEAQEEEASAAF
ncbi:MAG: hypothetical protein IPM76_03245 [Chloroflexi bacterium]|nr:hypothetical protein [Chloroflexota bacterium]